jgi:hypothetical protein
MGSRTYGRLLQDDRIIVAHVGAKVPSRWIRTSPLIFVSQRKAQHSVWKYNLRLTTEDIRRGTQSKVGAEGIRANIGRPTQSWKLREAIQAPQSLYYDTTLCVHCSVEILDACVVESLELIFLCAGMVSLAVVYWLKSWVCRVSRKLHDSVFCDPELLLFGS